MPLARFNQSHNEDVREWIFPWRESDRQGLLPRLTALALVGGAFAFLVGVVKIRVDSPEKTTSRKAAVIFLRDDAQGRALTLRAREGGPFPSRFELTQWQGLPELEALAMQATRFQPPAYAPDLEKFPLEPPIGPLKQAAVGQPFFPRLESTPRVIPNAGNRKIAPVLYPLSGVTAENLPKDLPNFEVAVNSAMTGADWRFLILLNSEGVVQDCFSLENGGEVGSVELGKWLRRIKFRPEPKKSTRWIAVAIGFTNQLTDGSDPR